MINKCSGQIVYAQMKTRQKHDWSKPIEPAAGFQQRKRRLRSVAISMAAVFCLGIGAVNLAADRGKTAQVLSHVDTGFEYDETLGRLQFVSSILPESAMAFLSSEDGDIDVFAPTNAAVTHTWSQDEPWIEYALSGQMTACSDGDVMTIVKNHDDEYTVRVVHDGGYESVYSGLCDVTVGQFDRVQAGYTIGNCENGLAFEWRKDGLSIEPQFQMIGGE